MSFHPEWLLENPIECINEEFKKRIHSNEEIRELFTSEKLTEVQKSLLFLESGKPFQKVWIVKHLSTFASQPNFKEVVSALIVRFK